VTANTTIGHIRATYNNLFLGNISLHGGNSGGPILSKDGVAVGIASAVKMEKVDIGSLSVPVRQSDFAMILPIASAQALLARLKSGEPAWNGVPNPPMSAKIRQLVAEGSTENIEKAQQWVAAQVGSSVDPELLIFGGLVHVSLNDAVAAEPLLSKAATVNPRDGFARFLHYLNDWQTGNADTNRYRKELLSLDWRSPDEFRGYMARFLEGQISTEEAEKAGETERERDLLAWALASVDMKSNRLEKAEERLRQALLHDDGVDWGYLLIRARLAQVEREREKKLTGNALAHYLSEREAFRKSSKTASAKVQEKKAVADAFAGVLNDPKSAALILRKIVNKVPVVSDAPSYQMSLGFYEATLGNWKNAHLALENYLSQPGRESANYLGSALMSAQLLALTGQQKESQKALKEYVARTNDPWYRKLAQGALGEVSAEALEAEASESPEKILTSQFMLGLKAEGEKNPSLAQQHYAMAFESFLPNWMEYLFAKERLKTLRSVK